MAVPTVSLTDVTKRYGERRALDGISFEILAGEAVGYLGPNGAGKSTTMKLLIGLARPDHGTVSLAGFDPHRQRDHALARVGALVETPGVVPFVHGRDLLTHVAAVRGVPARERAAEVRRVADRTGVSAHLDRPVGGLSTGLHRRLLLAAALVGEPAVLLLDEPTLGLDPAGRRGLREVLTEERRAGRTLLISTHLLDDVEQLCQRVLFLREGRLVGDEPVTGPRGLPSSAQRRRLRVRFARDVPAERVLSALSPDTTARADSVREWTVELDGDEREQAALIARLVGAGLPVSAATVPDSDLARRYLELVGREDAA